MPFPDSLKDDIHMTSMKNAQFSRPATPTPLVHLRPTFFHPLDLGRPISNNPTPHLSPNDNQTMKIKSNARMANFPFSVSTH